MPLILELWVCHPFEVLAAGASPHAPLIAFEGDEVGRWRRPLLTHLAEREQLEKLHPDELAAQRKLGGVMML